MVKHFDVSLARHFVRDYRLPILITTSEATFGYELKLYEKNYGSLTKWNDLTDAIDLYFDGNISKFLEEYASARDKIISTVMESDRYEYMNSSEMNDNIKRLIETYPFPEATYTKGIYNQATINKKFISIDLKKANFQVLKNIGAIKSETYEDFMMLMTDIPYLQEYLKNSKYIRQATFGKLNASRQTKIERCYLSVAMHSVIASYMNYNDYKLSLAYFGTDEIVLELPKEITDEDIETLVEKIDKSLKENITNVNFRVESYYLEGYEFYAVKPDGHESKLGEFYHRSCDGFKYKAIPLPYNKVITKLLNNKIPNDDDKELMYEKCRVRLLDDIIIKKL